MGNSTELVTVTEQKQRQLLTNGLVAADKFINKNYLIDLSEQSVMPIEQCDMATNTIRLLQIEKLVYDKEENINDKLISVYSALQDVNSSVLMIINGDGRKVTLYIGIRSARNASTASKILEKSFMGNFPGSTLRTNIKNAEIEEIMRSFVTSSHINTQRNVSCVTVIPSTRDEDKDQFVQGIEKFIDTMQNEKYTAILIAAPVSKNKLEQRKRGFEELFSSLSPFMKTSLAYGENYSKAVTAGMYENFSHSVNNSISNTTGRNSGTSVSETHGRSSGSSGGGGGFSANTGTSHSKTTGYSSGSSWSKSVTEGTADTTGTGTNQSDTETNGNSRTLTIEHQNKSIAVLQEQIEEQLKRIKACEAFGVWECAAYFLADDIQTSVVAANAYKALMLGDQTNVENAFLNVWGGHTSAQTGHILAYLQYGLHPQIEIPLESGYETQVVTPANLVSGKELTLTMGLPRKSVTGVTVSSMAEFGRNIFLRATRKNSSDIHIGKVHHMGRDEETDVNLNLNELTAHCFITGSTGSGKSNTTYCLIERLIQNQIPFLVIEPAKGEYKDAFGKVDGLNVFSTNPSIGQMIKLNPFRFDKNIHVLEHLDRLVEIFNACWEMYAAMPAIMKDAVERIYMEKGWDLLNSVYLGEGEPEYPTFNDLMRTLPQIINSSSYSSDSKGDYTGALVTRVKSLTNGISGQIFCDCYDIPDTILFDQNTVIDLSRVGSSETKSLMMGILVLKLSEYRMANAVESNSGLRHVTIMEEAHNLLKRSPQGTAGSSVIGKSVEMICNSIAEMRTYGEGFIIVDQSPSAVDIAAIKNTNTKILMRLPEKEDCEAVGNAVGLEEDQVKELAKLSTGIAVVMQSGWLEAVLTHIDPFQKAVFEEKLKPASYSDIRALKSALVRELMDQYIRRKQMEFDPFRRIIDGAQISIHKKREYLCCLEFTIKQMQKNWIHGKTLHLFCESLMNISGAKGIFGIVEGEIKKGKEGEGLYDRNSVLRWRQKFLTELSKCLDLPEEYNFTLFRYLLHAKQEEAGIIDYNFVENILK